MASVRFSRLIASFRNVGRRLSVPPSRDRSFRLISANGQKITQIALCSMILRNLTFHFVKGDPKAIEKKKRKKRGDGRRKKDVPYARPPISALLNVIVRP